MTRIHRHLQLIAIVLGMCMVVAGALPAAVSAKPHKDVRPVATKVLNFSDDCKAFGGKATTRPSATDGDKTIANCNGGTLSGWACVYTPRTTDCVVTRPK